MSWKRGITVAGFVVVTILGPGPRAMAVSPDSTAAAEAAPYRMPAAGAALLDHLHNKLVHFPIVLTLVATALLIAGRRRPELQSVGFWLVWVSALSTLAAYFSGRAAEEAFEHGPKAWLVELHERQGLVLGIGQALWVLALLREGTRRRAWLLGLLLCVVVGGASFLGGVIAHGK